MRVRPETEPCWHKATISALKPGVNDPRAWGPPLSKTFRDGHSPQSRQSLSSISVSAGQMQLAFLVICGVGNRQVWE